MLLNCVFMQGQQIVYLEFIAAQTRVAVALYRRNSYYPLWLMSGN